MTDTPKTPIQFPEDDRVLLRQLFGLVQNLATDMQDVKVRLTALENSRDTVGRLDKLVLAVAETRQELRELRQEVKELRQEVEKNGRDLDNLRQEVVELRQEVKELRQEVVELRQEVKELRQEVVELRQEVKENSKGLDELRQEFTVFRSEANNRADKLETEFKSYRRVTETTFNDQQIRQTYLESQINILQRKVS